MPKQKEITRDYKFSDGKLKQKADLVVMFIRRPEDAIVFAARNVTPATLTAFEVVITDFDDAPGDEIPQGKVKQATEIKDAKGETLREAIRVLRTMVENKWGVYHSAYTMYKFERLNDTPDDTLHRLARAVRFIAPEQLADLASEGLTQAMIDNITALDLDFDNAIDLQLNAIAKRDAATHYRISKGNIVYKELHRLCNIGKNLYASTNEALYNDYVLYKTKTGEAPEGGTEYGSLSGVVTNGETGEPIADTQILLKCNGIPDIVLQADEYGEFDVESAPVEITAIVAEMFGYQPYAAPLEVPPGADVIHDIIMIPITPPPIPPPPMP